MACVCTLDAGSPARNTVAGQPRVRIEGQLTAPVTRVYPSEPGLTAGGDVGHYTLRGGGMIGHGTVVRMP